VGRLPGDDHCGRRYRRARDTGGLRRARRELPRGCRRARLGAAAARTPLELGSKSPAIIDDTADLDYVANYLVRGKIYNHGQTMASDLRFWCPWQDSNLLFRRDDCQSSALRGPVGSGQVKLGGVSGQRGLVRCSRAWWNVQSNSQDLWVGVSCDLLIALLIRRVVRR